MKQKFIIITFLVFTLLAAFALKANANDSTSVLIADETTLKELKTGARIDCSNDQVHFKLYQKWQHTFTRYSWSWKKDRKGPYKQYSITVSRKDADLIREWAKTNL